MYKIVVKKSVVEDVLWNKPKVKEGIIKDMMVAFAEEMFKNDCLQLTEVRGFEYLQVSALDIRKLSIAGYVISPEEFKEIVKLVLIIKSVLPMDMEEYANKLLYVFNNYETINR